MSAKDPSPTLNVAIEMFKLNEWVLDGVCKDFDNEDWAFQPSPETNHSLWLLGHLAFARRAVLRRLDPDFKKEAWEDDFGIGSKPKATSECPSPEVLRQDLRDIGERLFKRFAKMTPEEAQADWSLPVKGYTAEQSIHFFHFHEAYHVGQIGTLRRLRGKPGVA